MKWGLIGYGDLANTCIAPALHEAEGSTFCGVWGRQYSRTKEFAKKHKIPVAYENLEELLNGPLDAIYVGTPVDSHCEYTLAALRSGKHVIVEKPMASNVAECEQMVATAASKNLKLGVAYNTRNGPKMQKVKELIESGMLGKITYVNICFNVCYVIPKDDPKYWRLQKARSGGGGAVADEGVHFLDLLDFWLGPSDVEFSSLDRLVYAWEVEDSATAVLRLKNSGAPVHFYCAWNSKGQTLRFEIFGSEGKIAVDPIFNKQIIIQRGSEKEILTVEPLACQHMHYTKNIEDFMESIATGRPSICDGETGLRTNQILEKILNRNVNPPPAA